MSASCRRTLRTTICGDYFIIVKSPHIERRKFPANSSREPHVSCLIYYWKWKSKRKQNAAD